MTTAVTTPLGRVSIHRKFFNQEKFAAAGASRRCRLALGVLGAGLCVLPASVWAANLDIPAQPLSSALTEFGRQADIQILYDPDQVRELTSPALRGDLEIAEALNLLLAGTNINYQIDGSIVVLTKPGSNETPGSNGDGITTLPAITVTGDLERADGPVNGYVAQRSATGTKTDVPLVEVPQSISVIPTEQMEDRGVQTESQALLYSAGVLAQPYGDSLNAFNNFYSIRGFPTSFGGSYVDGTVSPVNHRYEPYAYERIEVLRGPASGLYGQSDPGGVVNRVRKRPSAEAHYEGVVEYNNFNTPQLSLDATGALDDDGRFLYRLTGTGSDGHVPTQDLRFDQELDQERLFLAPSFTWNITPDTSLTLLADYQKDNSEELSTFIAPGYEATNIRLDGNPGTDYNYEDWSVGYDFDHTFDDTLKFSQTFRYSRMDYDYTALFQSAAVNDPFDGENIDRFADGFDESREDLAIDSRLQKDFSFGMTDHTLLVGFDFQRLQDEYTFSFGFPGPPLNLLDPDYSTPFDADTDFISVKATTYNYGLYLQDQVKIDDSWILTLGLRHDWNGTASEDLLAGGTTKTANRAMSYRVGLGYEFDSGIVPYVSYAESFLPASGTDRFLEPFEPTTGRQWEVGVKYQPADFPGLFTVAAYDLTKQNVLTPDPVNNNFSIQTGEIRSQGIELEATAEVFDGVKLQAAYAFNYSKVTKSNDINEGDRASLAPRNMASLWVNYDMPASIVDGLSFGAGVRYVGSSYAFDRSTNGNVTDRHKNDATTLVDAAIRYDLGKLTPMLDNAELALNVSNLFDTSYQVCYTRFNCQLGEPLVAMGRLKLRW